MNREFVPYNIALALKELGFTKACMASYKSTGDLKFFDFWQSNNAIPLEESYKDICSAPLYQQAFRWFIEEYNLYSIIVPNSLNTDKWRYRIESLNKSIVLEHGCDQAYWIMGTSVESYEEAEIVCITKLIELVKSKNHE